MLALNFWLDSLYYTYNFLTSLSLKNALLFFRCLLVIMLPVNITPTVKLCHPPPTKKNPETKLRECKYKRNISDGFIYLYFAQANLLMISSCEVLISVPHSLVGLRHDLNVDSVLFSSFIKKEDLSKLR